MPTGPQPPRLSSTLLTPFFDLARAFFLGGRALGGVRTIGTMASMSSCCGFILRSGIRLPYAVTIGAAAPDLNRTGRKPLLVRCG